MGNIFYQIQLFFGNYFFRQDFAKQKRNVIVNNFKSANNVGIIFYADSEETYNIISKFSILLKKEGVKDVKMLGFAKEKTLPHYLNVKPGQDFFIKKNLNWHLKPNSTAVWNFIYEPFDILIDLTTSTIFPLKYILGLSRADFKVGKGIDEKVILLDMMINTSNGEGLEHLTKHIIHYLRQINKVDGGAGSVQSKQ